MSIQPREDVTTGKRMLLVAWGAFVSMLALVGLTFSIGGLVEQGNGLFVIAVLGSIAGLWAGVSFVRLGLNTPNTLR